MGTDTHAIGVKTGSNYLQADIYRYRVGSTDSVVTPSGRQSSGSTAIAAWARPGDKIQFRYTMCAGGEIARQFAGSSVVSNYYVSANEDKYIFGSTMTADPTTHRFAFGTPSSTPGVGPFPGNSYVANYASPDGYASNSSNEYSCDAFGGGTVNNTYRIPPKITNTDGGIAQYSDATSCKSVSTSGSDVGKTITQTASWTDIQYEDGRPVTGHNGAAASISASVHVPYNYAARVVINGSGGYVYAGSKIDISSDLEVKGRTNDTVDTTTVYATQTKPSRYQTIRIVVQPTVTLKSYYPEGSGSSGFNEIVNAQEYFLDSNGGATLSNNRTGLNICRYSGISCAKVNGMSDSNTTTVFAPGKTSLGSASEVIEDDLRAGTKICYLSAVWPADSHQLQANWNTVIAPFDAEGNVRKISTTDDQSRALSTNGYYWHLSGATCFTVAKRPSIAVRGGDVYASGYIAAKAQVHTVDRNGNTISPARVYGSWGEYGVIAGGDIRGFSSGAGLWGGYANASETVSRDCTLSSITYANSKCSEGTLGHAEIDQTASSDPYNIVGQIKARYTDSSATGTTNLQVKNGGLCKYENGTYVPDGAEAGATYTCLPSTGAKYTHVKNNETQPAYIPSGTNYCLAKNADDSNRTSVIHADNTLVIATNMVTGNKNAVGPALSGACYADTYANVSEIPQNIIIAKRIIIKDTVERIDAWLIADELITCDPVPGYNNNVDQSSINSNNCTTPLTLNGPVMAKTIKLYRTYGAEYTSSGSDLRAQPAERFTLTPETYLWSANQARRYSQAVTTYSRELAPRY